MFHLLRSQSPSASKGLAPDLSWNQPQFVTEFRGGVFRPTLNKGEASFLSEVQLILWCNVDLFNKLFLFYKL